MRLDHFGVRQQQGPIPQGGFLGPEEKLASSYDIGVIAGVERIAQHKVAKLRQHDRRQLGGALACEVEIGGLQRARLQKMVAEDHHEGPVFLCIRISHGCDVLRADGAHGVLQQRSMERAFGVAGLIRGRQFGPREISHDEFGRGDEPAMRRAPGQVMAGGNPEFSHVRSVFNSP